MPKTLEEVVKDLYTFKPKYDPWEMKCLKVERNPELDTEDEEGYLVEVEVTYDQGEPEIMNGVFFLTKLVRGSLTINGRRKQSIYTAIGNDKIRIFSGTIAWGFKPNQKVDIDCRSNRFTVTDYVDGEEKVLNCAVSNFFKYTETWEPSMILWFNAVDYAKAEESAHEDVENIKNIIDTVKINENTLNKIKFLSKRDTLDSTLTKDTVKSLVYILDHDTYLRDRPTPLDYEFLDTYQALTKELDTNWSMKKDIQREITFQLGRNHSFSCRKLQAKINDFMHGRDSEFSQIQEFTDSNALSVAELNSKIYFESWKDNGYQQERLNPQFFVGIIDPVFTADSDKVNVKNELSIGSSIRDGKLYVTVMDKKFKKVELPVFKYMMSAVLSSDNVDYLNKKIFPIDGKFTVYKYGEYMSVSSESEVDYVRMEDSILTESTSMIPFLNKTQSMRAMLGAHMMTQAIPVSGAQPSFVYTGKGEALYDTTALNKETSITGVVKAVTDDIVRLETSEGTKLIKCPKPYVTSFHSTNLYKPSVQVGQKVRAGDTIFECNSFKNKDYSISVPLLTAYTSWYAREHEDAVVLSESAAAKFTHDTLYTQDVTFKANEELILGKSVIEEYPDLAHFKDNFDELGFVKVGTVIQRGDPLFVCNKVRTRGEDVEIKRALGITPVSRLMITADYEVTDGVVIGYEFKPVKGFNDKFGKNATFATVAAHMGRISKDKQDLQAKQVGVESSTLGPVGFRGVFNDDPNFMCTVEIKIMYKNYLKKSDKMSNFYGSKGVVSTIVPDDKMLRLEDGTVVDIILSPLAVISRINISQLYVGILGLISKELFNRIKAFEESDKKDTKEEELLKSCVKDVLYERPDTPLSKVLKENLPYGFVRIRAGSFDRYFTSELLTDLMNRLGVKDHQTLFDPISSKYVRTPIRVGYQDFMRLHFMPEHKTKVTGGGRSDKMFGIGSTKKGGQKIGESESWALMAHGDLDLLNRFSKERDDKAARFQQELLSIGMMLNDRGDDVS